MFELAIVGGGRTGGEETSSEDFALEGGSTREDGEPTTLSDTNARSLFGVAGVTSEASCSLALLILMMLDSVRARPSIRRATLLCGLGVAREGPAEADSAVKEKMSEMSLACRRGE